VRRPTQAIVMNALNLDVAAATLRGPRGKRVALAPPAADAATQTIAFALPAPLAPGRYTLAMAWRGTINGAVEGLYLDRQVDAGGEHLTLATDLEPTSARRVLPCWDEPVFRARFRLTVDLGAGTSAYSNMPVAHSAPLAGGGRRVAFEATPPMPTYLLALVAGDLERVETTVDGTRVGVVTSRGKLGRTAYPLARAQRCCAISTTTSRCRIRCPSSTTSRSRAAFPAAWRTGARSSTTRRSCSSTRRPRPRRCASASTA
jgi:aminopeptidase N